jgi:hypothetical protein
MKEFSYCLLVFLPDPLSAPVNRTSSRADFTVGFHLPGIHSSMRVRHGNLPIILLVYTWYMVKRAPIYRAGKAVDLLCAVCSLALHVLLLPFLK